MPMRKLREYLDAGGADYVATRHRESFTAQETAELCHVPGQNMAKTVMVRVNGSLAMAVLPAKYQLDLFKLQDFTHAYSIKLADESDFDDAFPECELGAMPPFGNLFGMDVFADESLSHDINISFNGGTHDELISMPYGQWKNLVHPSMAQFHR